MAKLYPGIRRAAQLIALDNGGINRDRPAGQQDRDFTRWIERQPQEPLGDIDKWLAGLTEDEMGLVCCAGCEPESASLMAAAPPFLDELLTRYFEEVC